MAQPTRQEALATLADGQARVDQLLSGLTEEELATPATIGGGEWSAADLLGHLAFWEELALEALTSWRAGRKPRVEELFARLDTIDRVNQEDYERKRSWSAERLRTEASRGHGDLVAQIEAMGEEEWRSKAPYPTERRQRLGVMLGSVTGAPQRPFGHAFAHLPDLEAYVRSLR
jgi:hypothetical protein